MILTPIAAEALPATLAAFGQRLASRPVAAAAFARIAASRDAGGPEDTPARRRQAVDLARAIGIPTIDEMPAAAFSWDGRALRTDSEAWVVLHEIAHWQLAPPERRCLLDFGLGAGPETGRKAEADAVLCLDEPARATEEAAASLLGILWEVALGQPAIHAFLEQNWLEGWERPAAAEWFAATIDHLYAARLIDAEGRPAPRARDRPAIPAALSRR
ncbi:MAG: elongation factor P hydroxylase [Alphaproteobacteria bacterium]|nr:elongation factor P hydroxylase [Alphaproteobacteria bacterium]